MGSQARLSRTGAKRCNGTYLISPASRGLSARSTANPGRRVESDHAANTKDRGMKRFILVFVLALGMPCVALSTLQTPSASAESCFRSWVSEWGAYTTSSCGVAGPPLTWVWASNTFNWERTDRGGDGVAGVYCAKVKAALPSWFEDAVCTKRRNGTGQYSLIVAEPGCECFCEGSL